MIFPTCSRLPSAPCIFITSPTSSGERKIPSRLEAEAEQTAAATLPPASDVKAMADCTVAGKIHRYRKPVYSIGSTLTGAHQANRTPRTGKTTNVLHITHRCKRQWLPPAIMASRESFAPCIKNSRAMAAVVKPSKKGTKPPSAGKKDASKTTVISVIVNGSRIRKSFIKTPEIR